MANLNKVMLIGNLTRDPELKYLPSQTAVCDFGMAVNRTWTGQDGVKKEEVTFVDCSAFGRTAENINRFIQKGNPLFVEGRLKLDQWESQDGSKRSKMRVIVETCQFLPNGQRRQDDQEGYRGEEDEAPPARQQARQPGGGWSRGQQAPRQPPARQTRAENIMADPNDPIPEDSAPVMQDDDIPF